MPILLKAELQHLLQLSKNAGKHFRVNYTPSSGQGVVIFFIQKMMFKIKILIVLISWTIIYSCKSNEETPTVQATEAMITTEVKLTEAQFKNTNLQTSVPEKMLIGHKVTLNGKIEVMPEHTITISSPMAGFIKQLKLIPGMNVSKGQTLVRLEDKDSIQLQQDYLSAKNTLYYAKLDMERQAELPKNQAASDKVWQLAEEKVKQTQITLSLWRKTQIYTHNPATLTADNMTSQITISAPVHILTAPFSDLTRAYQIVRTKRRLA